MQTNLSDEFRDTPEGKRAEAILRRCVHCGFCTATCPTYQLLGDELDGPRGRIYLIKQVMEGEAVTCKTQQHLDRCLTCRSCETTCPSGVEYAALLDIGRRVVEKKVSRPPLERARRSVLRETLDSPVFPAALKAGRLVRPLLPKRLRQQVPLSVPDRKPDWQGRTHPRKVLLPVGCVQPSLAPNIDAATRRVLNAAGITAISAAEGGCCGAIRLHLSDHSGAKAAARSNIDAWWPHVESGAVEAIVSNASGCGITVKEYSDLFDDDEYADKARRIAAITKDVSELMPDIVAGLRGKLNTVALKPVVVHTPCTLQHGHKLHDSVIPGLRELGFTVRPPQHDAHLCCGSAGTYSILQPELSQRLRERKLESLAPDPNEYIVSANVGCIHHLQSGTTTPVRHWIEVIDAALAT